MASPQINQTRVHYDEAIVAQLGRIWGVNEVLSNFGILRFSAKPIRENCSVYDKISPKVFDSLEKFQILDCSTISELRHSSAEEIEEKLDRVKDNLIKEHDEAFEALRMYPPSLVKASSWMEAEVRFDPLPWEGVIWKNFSNQNANSRLRSYRDEKSNLPYIKYPRSAYDARNISHYELAVGLCQGSPDRFVLDFERTIQDDLDATISNWESHHASEYASFSSHPELVNPQPFEVCFSLWLWTDITRFRTRFRSHLDKLLPLLFGFVLPNGTLWLPEPRNTKSNEASIREDHIPRANLMATCLLANCLFAIGREDWVERYALPACEWIAGKQNSDGRWSDRFFLDINGESVLATFLAVAALKKSGQRKFAHYIDLGHRSLIEAQTESGAWATDFVDASLITRKVPAHFSDSVPSWDTGTDSKLNRSGLEFIEIAKQLLEQGGDANAKMSIVALAHGFEFQIYSLLSSQQVSINIFRKDGQQTIGAREAMSKLHEHLVNEGKALQSSGLKFQSQISLMISTRDSVVHKNASISRIDLEQWIAEVETFVRHYRSQL